jgi:hypothetical protein
LQAQSDPNTWLMYSKNYSGWRYSELKQMLECMDAIAPIQARGTKVALQMEFAAAMLAWACSRAYESATAQGDAADGPERYASAEDLIVRRARELNGQGGRKSPDLF